LDKKVANFSKRSTTVTLLWCLTIILTWAWILKIFLFRPHSFG